jgi:hypothetical protein
LAGFARQKEKEVGWAAPTKKKKISLLSFRKKKVRQRKPMRRR